MRDQDTIKQELDDTREDLAHHLGDLTAAVRDKVDVKARARRAVDHGKQQVGDFFEHARGELVSRYEHTIETARERPALAVSVLGAIVAIVGVTGYLIYAHRRDAC